MALEQHKTLQMWEESTNKRHFMALIPDKPWEVSLLAKSDYYLSALGCILSGYSNVHFANTDLFVSQNGNTQSEVELVHGWESHIHYPLSH